MLGVTSKYPLTLISDIDHLISRHITFSDFSGGQWKPDHILPPSTNDEFWIASHVYSDVFVVFWCWFVGRVFPRLFAYGWSNNTHDHVNGHDLGQTLIMTNTMIAIQLWFNCPCQWTKYTWQIQQCRFTSIDSIVILSTLCIKVKVEVEVGPKPWGVLRSFY